MASARLTQEISDQLMFNIRQGVPQRTAALSAGIGESTFYTWRARGEKARSGKYRDFYLALVKAQADAEKNLVLKLQKHASTEGSAGVGAIKFLLACRFPERWAERHIVENRMQDHKGGPAPSAVSINLAALTPAQLAAITGTDLGDDGEELHAPLDPGTEDLPALDIAQETP